MLCFIIIFLLITQSTCGPIKFIHLYETCVDSATGIAELFFCLVNPSVAIICDVLIENVGSKGMFAFYAGVTFVGLIYYSLFFRDTTFGYDHNHRRFIRMTDKQKQELYMPDELKESVIQEKLEK